MGKSRTDGLVLAAAALCLGAVGRAVSAADLTVLRPYGGRPAGIDFGAKSQAILSLPLPGGERIRWAGAKTPERNL